MKSYGIYEVSRLADIALVYINVSSNLVCTHIYMCVCVSVCVRAWLRMRAACACVYLKFISQEFIFMSCNSYLYFPEHCFTCCCYCCC